MKVMAQALVGLELEDLGAVLGPGQPAYRARQLYDAIYRRRQTEIGCITTLPRDLKERLAKSCAVGLPAQAARYDSVDGTRR